jgi:4-diphosphocytidyl-2-C-methyl-D-erythritol kinase
MKSISLRSPAKVNLYLKVLNKRPDGLHNIVTLFERINLFDDIRFKTNKSGKIRLFCNHPHVPIGPKNLIYKVAKKLQEECNVKEGVDVDIRKRIPVAAGLAGGSSNAATALLGLNKLWNLHLTKKRMVEYAASLGSDIAFFLFNTSWALGTEKGSQIKPLQVKTKLWHILVVPKIKVYSGQVYNGLKLGLTKKRTNVNILIHHLRKNHLDDVSHLMTNDLESEVVRICPQLMRIKQQMRSLQAISVMVSGSGPCVYGLTQTEQHALRIKKVLSKKFSQVFVAETL